MCGQKCEKAFLVLWTGLKHCTVLMLKRLLSSEQVWNKSQKRICSCLKFEMANSNSKFTLKYWLFQNNYFGVAIYSVMALCCHGKINGPWYLAKKWWHCWPRVWLQLAYGEEVSKVWCMAVCDGKSVGRDFFFCVTCYLVKKRNTIWVHDMFVSQALDCFCCQFTMIIWEV